MGEQAQGLKAAVALTEGDAAGNGPGEPQATQLALYPADQLGALPQDPGARQAQLRRGPGRPPGALNRKTQDWAQLIVRKYRSPLIFLAEVYSRRVGDLAAELGCKPIEALEIQRRAASELAPYLHGKMPVQVEVKGNLPLLVLGDPAQILEGVAAELGGDALPSLAQLQPVENQALSATPAAGVGQPELDSTGNAQADQQDSAAEPLIADQPASQPEEQR